MGDHEVITCLSVAPHEDNILDVCLHYFGCLRYEQRSDYFDTLSPDEKRLIVDRERRIQRIKEDVKQEPTTIPVVNALAESLHEFRSLNLPTRLRPIRQTSNISGSELAHRSCDGMSARMVLFRDGEPYEDPDFPQHWPDQKLPLGDLLYDRSPDNPLAKARASKDNMIQWFHLPANDMGWIEGAISRYYGEESPNTESLSGPPSKTRELLRREFWRGQQQGGDLDPTHARHMKPRCDIISMNPSYPGESLKKNLVLFMPYMHWDTYRKTSIRSKITKTKEEHHTQERRKRENERYDKAKEHFDKKGLIRARPVPLDRNSSSGPTISSSSTRKSSIFRLFSRPRSAELDEKPLSRSAHLGRVFIKAAILFEKMEYFYEEVSLKLSIYAQAPLHPRRTLHQYRYGTLKTTEKLDKTQVVYRRTAPLREYLHHPACKEKDRRKCQHAHCEEEKTRKFRDCRQCFSDSQKLPRLIMVDQLWLWVLDERTIITSFPRSWGRDPHSVHKRIRMRLKAYLPGEIQSAYDLSLAIVDQCSGVIFERTRVMEKQPPVIDMFQDAIGSISDRQTLAASHFWSNVAEASRVLSSQDKIETTTMYKIFLNVIREGKLLGEIGGILDELHIMLQIQDQQNRVLRGFSKHVARLLSASMSRYESGGDRRSSWLGPQTSPGLGPRGGMRLEVDGSWGVLDPAKNTMSHVKELAENLEDHIADLNGLEETGRQISSSLERLVDLKLQQAGVIQAQEASEEALKQGRSIMLFTVITIIFLPLSFVASVFSMSTAATDYRDGLMTFSQEFIYMVPTSLAFALLVLVIALSATVRGMIIYTLQLPFTWFTLVTNLDLFYTKLIPNGHSLTERSKREIRDMRARANLARHVRAGTRSEKEAIRRIQREAVETFGAPVRTDTDLGGEVLGEEVNGREKRVFLEGEDFV